MAISVCSTSALIVDLKGNLIALRQLLVCLTRTFPVFLGRPLKHRIRGKRVRLKKSVSYQVDLKQAFANPGSLSLCNIKSSIKIFTLDSFRWDCDPIWSSALWFSLLLGLFLIAILAWAIEMLVTLQTPSRFDDPKGKPLVVPLTD